MSSPMPVTGNRICYHALWIMGKFYCIYIRLSLETRRKTAQI